MGYQKLSNRPWESVGATLDLRGRGPRVVHARMGPDLVNVLISVVGDALEN